MKQNITTEQFQELSPESQRELFEFFFHDLIGHPIHCTKNVWYGPVDINPEYVTIGKMIEFLKNETNFNLDYSGLDDTWGVRLGEKEYGDKELCEALWKTVKAKLEPNKDSF